LAWLEVSLTVSGELAEAAADVLARFAPGGVAVEAAGISLPQADESPARPDAGGAAALFEAGAAGPLTVRAYLPQDDQLEETRARLADALGHLAWLAAQSGLRLPGPGYRAVAEADWAEQWKEHYQPIRVGRRLVIVPAWLSPALAPADVPIRLDPGMAFGTGTHPTTQLCLAALEDLARPGEPVLDLGTGSGILAIAAAKLGARPVLALDIDAEAVRAARENVAANEVSDSVRVEQGTLSPSLFIVHCSLVICNILSSVIIRLLDEGLARAAAPGGRLILSGILDSQAAAVKQAAVKAGLSVDEQRQMGEWVAILATRL
jgi:ribosomal protein L11 methyltransferase